MRPNGYFGMVLLLTLRTSLHVVVISNNVQTVKVQGLYIPVVAAKRLFIYRVRQNAS